MDLEDIMLSEISQTKKDKYPNTVLSHLLVESKTSKQKNKFIDTEKRLVVARGQGVGDRVQNG